MVDGGFFKKEFAAVKSRDPSSLEVEQFCQKLAAFTQASDQLLRIYYYDSQPIKLDVKKPISQQPLNLASVPTYLPNVNRIARLKQTDSFAVREGRVVFRGWKLKKSSIGKPSASLTDADFSPDIQQKGVDMKIGLDIAWISYCKIVEKIIVVTGDSDFIPAFKLARRNGIQVHLFTLGHGAPTELLDHADFLEKKTIDQF
jgi:Uncharacterized conserved protein